MRRDVAISSAVLVACASVAAGGNTRFIMEVSGDGGATWHRSMSVAPGTEVKARLNVEYVGDEPVLGLAGFNARFGVTGWQRTTDSSGAWGSPVSHVTGAAGGVAPGENGRVSPFGNPGLERPILSEVSASGDMLYVYGWLSGGLIPMSQGPPSAAGSHFNASRSPVVFAFSFRPGESSDARTMRVSAIDIALGSDADAAFWYTGSHGTAIVAPQLADSENLRSAIVNVTPGPGACGVLGVAGLMSSRRRRHRGDQKARSGKRNAGRECVGGGEINA